MTNREKKQWLLRGWRLDKEIKTLLEAKQRAFEAVIGTTAAPVEDKVQTSNINRHENALIRYADFERCLDEQTDRLITIKKEIAEAIFKIENSTLRTLLVKRYIDFKTWEQIAEEMDYDPDHVRKNLHSLALMKIYPKIPG